MDSCDQCGFVYASLPPEVAPDRLRGLAPAYRALLVDVPADALRRRPEPEVWSALEYACHVRDVMDVQRARLARALAEEEPTYTSMGRDELVVTKAYNAQDPVAVAEEVAVALAATAGAFAALDAAGWLRTGVYTWPERAVRDMRWLARHTVHEGEHHLLDARASAGDPGM